MKSKECNFCKRKIKEEAAYFESKTYHSKCLELMKNRRLNRKYEKEMFEIYLNRLIKKHNEILKREDEFRGSITLEKYKIYSKVYELAKKKKLKITYEQMAKKFRVSRTSIKRTLSLKEASEESWKLIKQNKISALRVAEIIYSKGKKHEKEIVEWAVKKNATRHEIMEYKTGEEKSMKNLGWSYVSLIKKIEQVDNLLIKSKNNLQESLRIKIKPHLKRFNKNINKILKEWQ